MFTRALGKLLELIAKLEKLLNNIITNQEKAFAHLKTFVEEDLEMPTVLMKRLYRYTADLEKHEPIPWYVSGEIVAIKEAALEVNIQKANLDEDEKREIALRDFPEANPQVGQRFFARIHPDKPETVYDIVPLEYRQRTSDEIFISLFGKDIYEKAATC